MEKKTAIVFGATGLVGSELMKQLAADERYAIVKVFVRRDPGILDNKAEIAIVDVSDVKSYSEKISGDELYICLGTTIKKAGSIEAMESTDRDMPAEIAGIARENGVRVVSVVSSIGADAGSRNYYLRIKGEMEEEIAATAFDRTIIVRPSILLGNRNENRFGEEAGKFIMKSLRFLFIGRLRKYRGIEARDVAKAMIRLVNTNPKPEKIVFESDEL